MRARAGDARIAFVRALHREDFFAPIDGVLSPPIGAHFNDRRLEECRLVEWRVQHVYYKTDARPAVVSQADKLLVAVAPSLPLLSPVPS